MPPCTGIVKSLHGSAYGLGRCLTGPTATLPISTGSTKYEVRATANYAHKSDHRAVYIPPGDHRPVLLHRQGTVARRGLRDRAAVLVLVVILVIAGVVVYIVRAVKPKRVKIHARVLKIIDMGLEADGGEQSVKGAKGLPPVRREGRRGLTHDD